MYSINDILTHTVGVSDLAVKSIGLVTLTLRVRISLRALSKLLTHGVLRSTQPPILLCGAGNE